jgi:hypothetical protein
MKLDKVSEEDLKAELARRQRARDEAENERTRRAHALVVEHVDALLALTPEHSYSTCSDENLAYVFPDNGYQKCNRCGLLEIKRCGCNLHDLVLTLELRVKAEKALDAPPRR